MAPWIHVLPNLSAVQHKQIVDCWGGMQPLESPVLGIKLLQPAAVLAVECFADSWGSWEMGGGQGWERRRARGGWISPSHPSHYDISSLGFTQCMYSRTGSYSALHITHVSAQANSVGVMPCRCLNVSSGAAMIITQLVHYRNIYHQQFTITASIIPMSKLATWPREVQPWNSLIIESITLCRNPSQQSSQLSHPPYLTDY